MAEDEATVFQLSQLSLQKSQVCLRQMAGKENSPRLKAASEQDWLEGRGSQCVWRLLTSRCTRRCCSHSWSPRSPAGTCRCSCWHSGCRCPRSCRAHSDTRWCLSDTCPHEIQAGRCTRRSLSHPHTRLRSGRGLRQKHTVSVQGGNSGGPGLEELLLWIK